MSTDPSLPPPPPVVAASPAKAAAKSLTADPAPLSKIVVAIHGIGDQFENATIQTVVSRFGHHFKHPATVPLGSFQSADQTIRTFRLTCPPKPPQLLGDMGFVEVYWSGIPREVQKKGYTIEESKAWARSIVERVRARYGTEMGKELKVAEKDYRTAAEVLEEMIDTLKVLGNLLYLGEKAGLLKFDLDDLLTNFLGDVQIVADFPNYRRKILDTFHSVLGQVWTKVSTQVTPPEIYIVAHSEGTVVAFLCLLEALHAQSTAEAAGQTSPYSWIKNVRGFMTIGSPIDKHIILWPEMWHDFPTKVPPVSAGWTPIQWRNYYDYGDPAGFDLDTAREWLKEPEHQWDAFFDFQGPATRSGNNRHDIGFSRYLLPGAAHNEYWNDAAVFGHFIQTVMRCPPHPGTNQNFTQPPQTRWWVCICSFAIPYLIAFALLYTGTYLLHKTLDKYVGAASQERAADSIKRSTKPEVSQKDSYFTQWASPLRPPANK